MTKDIENKNYVETRSSQQDPVRYYFFKIQNNQISFVFVLKILKKKTDNANPKDAVGTEDNKTGFGLGKARKDARPQANIGNIFIFLTFQINNFPCLLISKKI